MSNTAVRIRLKFCHYIPFNKLKEVNTLYYLLKDEDITKCIGFTRNIEVARVIRATLDDFYKRGKRSKYYLYEATMRNYDVEMPNGIELSHEITLDSIARRKILG